MTPNGNAGTGKPTEIAIAQQNITGVQKYLSTLATVRIGGQDFTPAELSAVFQTEVNDINAADAARTAWRQKVADARATKARARAVRKALKSYVLGSFGDQAVAVIEDCGFAVPKKPGPKTVAAKATAVANVQATRKARHTMGTVQRKAVTGKSAAAAAPAPEPPQAPSPAPAPTPTPGK